VLDWDPARGSEQAGRRPGLVVSNDIGNRFGATVVVAAVTARPPRRAYPVTVRIPITAETGLNRESIVLCAQLITVSKDRLLRRVGALPPDLMRGVDDALRAALGLG
jgi:mRNA interferase MazF